MTAADLFRFIAACDLDPELRPWPILGDMMALSLKRGDLIFCRPVERYTGPGVYVLLDGLVSYVDRANGVVTLRPANRLYPPRAMPAEAFDAVALGRAEYAFNSMDPSTLPSVFAAAYASGWRVPL